MAASLVTSSSSVSSSFSAAAAAASPSPQPLIVILDTDAKATSDFFPFRDIARLNTADSPSSNTDADDFSFRQLIEDSVDGGQEILLFSSGCRLPTGETDCTRACNDTETFFGSLETFYNCAALASISYWTQDHMIYYISEEAERNASGVMGSGTLAQFDDRPVMDLFIGCALDACRNDGLAVPCNEAISALRPGTDTRDVLDAIENFCPAISAEVNPDIFGPGVLISYVFQVCFAILLYLSVKAFSIWVRYSEEREKRSAPRTPFGLTRIRTMIWSDSSAMSRTSIAIATTLVEFQEAQAWFVFAVQIASILAIVVNSQEGAFWGEIIVNAAVAYHISQNGVLPMFLVQICLHNEGIRNWHTFLGFLLEYLLAVIAATQTIKWHDAFELFRGQSDLPACGGNPSPRTYCAAIGSLDGTRISFFPHPVLYKMVFLVVDSIAIAVLVVDQLAWTLRRHRRTKHIRLGSYRAGRGPVGKYKVPWARFKTWFWRTLEVFYLVVNILYLVSLTMVINAESFAGNRWSYGQIIAVTVWGPVIVKLIDLLFSGPPKNGTSLNSGPPRLRIDNIINMRTGTDAFEEEEDFRKRFAERQAEIDAQDAQAAQDAQNTQNAQNAQMVLDGDAKSGDDPGNPTPDPGREEEQRRQTRDPERGDGVIRVDHAVPHRRVSRKDDDVMTQ